MTRRALVSWIDEYGQRVFGTLLRWDGDYAITLTGTRTKHRIHRSNLTFEMG